MLLGLLSGVAPYVFTPLFVLAVLPAFWAFGTFQADIALNPYLDEAERARWRIILACVPGGQALYFVRHVRPRTF
jgi:hypothetical protein